MPFCKNCQTEYKGNVSVCSDCGEIMEKASLDELEEMEAKFDDELIILYKSTSRDDTENLIDALKEAGVSYVFRRARGNGSEAIAIADFYNDHALDGEFCVKEDDYDRAREIAESVLDDFDDEVV